MAAEGTNIIKQADSEYPSAQILVTAQVQIDHHDAQVTHAGPLGGRGVLR